MTTTPSNVDALADGIQVLRLADKHASNLTPPPSEYSQKSQKSTSNHSDHEQLKSQQDKNAYIESLKEEREQLTQCSDGFSHVFALIDREIQKLGGGDLANFKVKPSATGGILSEIVRIPVEQYPEYNFVGRILGPRGSTAHQLEDTTGCRVTILGRVKKDSPPSNPSEQGPLRVQVSVPADAPDAARRMETGLSVVKALLIPPADGQDELKRQQLMMLARLNGTYKARNDEYSGSGDYDQHFQNLLPFGYNLPSSSDCVNPKCAILRGLIEQNTNTNISELLGMAELMNRVRLANSSFYSRQDEKSKFQEIGNRMCSTIGGIRRQAKSPTPITRRPYIPKPRQQSISNPSQ